MQNPGRNGEIGSGQVPLVGIDRALLVQSLLHFAAGLGILVIYLVLCGLALGLLFAAGWGIRSALPAIHGDVLPWVAVTLTGLLGVTTWGLSLVAATHLLDETGVELRAGLTWLILPVAPPLMLVLVCFHLVGRLAADAWRPLRLAGYVAGGLLVLGAATTAVLLAAR